MASTLGGIFWSYNAPGCFVWADVLDNGRIYVKADYKFVMQPIEDVAREIKWRTSELGIGRLGTIFADPEMFPKDTERRKSKRRTVIEAEAPSLTFARFGLPMVAAGSNREHGWQRMQDYLRNAPDGKPWIVLSPECVTLIRTLPTLVQQPSHPNDCEGDEYAANALRFILSSRPAPSALKTAKTAPTYAWGTLGWLKQLDAKEARTSGVLAR